MKIFLIQPEVTGLFKTPPLGLQLIATILKNHNFRNVFDIDPNKGDNPYFINYSGTDVLVGITITFMTISESFKLAKFIKAQNSNAVIVFGGPHATLAPDESINNESVDIVAIGEGLYTMLDVANRVKTGGGFDDIKGIWYKNEHGEIIKNEIREFIKNLDDIPYADRCFFTDRAYRRYQHNLLERIFIPETWHIMSAQSCPFNCRMCQPALRNIAGPWRQRSVANVIDEIRFLKKTYNAKHFSFNDNDMGVDRRWIENFCHEAKNINGIKLSCLGRANLLDYDLLKMMKESGFHTISFGAESGSNRVLKEIMNKKTSVQQIIDLATNCYNLKIKAYAYWMMANPGETIEEMKDTARLASELPVFYSHFHIATPNPGTHYYLDACQGDYLHLQSWDDVHDRKKPTIIQNNITVNDIIRMDEDLIETMTDKGWNYRYNGHTLSFINTRLFSRRYPLQIIGYEMKLFAADFKAYHLKNIALGLTHRRKKHL
jgi:anaerobic magnesium-protoporphyrin IX monomethyl ester cyclase